MYRLFRHLADRIRGNFIQSTSDNSHLNHPNIEFKVPAIPAAPASAPGVCEKSIILPLMLKV